MNLKNLLDVSSSQISRQSSSYFSMIAKRSPSYHHFHGGTDHLGWTRSNCYTTRRLYIVGHSYLRCHYHDLWWRMDILCDNRWHLQRYL